MKYLALSAVLLLLGGCNLTIDGDASLDTAGQALREDNFEPTSVRERDAGVLLALKNGGARSCSRTLDCPWGAFCNPSTNLCDWECLENDPARACPAGLTCGWSGRCVSSAPGAPVAQGLRLVVTPRSLEFDPPAGVSGEWIAQHVTVKWAGAPKVGAQSAEVSIQPGPGLEVSCVEPPLFGAGCRIRMAGTDGGTPAGSDARIAVRPRAGTSAPPNGKAAWELHITSPSSQTEGTQVIATVSPTPSGAPGVREFAGQLIVRGQAPKQDLLRLPVRAWANADTVVLFDPSRTLALSGKIQLTRSGATYVSPWLPQSNTGMTAAISGQFGGLPEKGTPLSLAFDVELPLLGGIRLSAAATLAQIEPTATKVCTSDSSCAAGYSCDPALRACVAGYRRPMTISGQSANNMKSSHREAWEPEWAGQQAALLDSTRKSPWQLAEAILCSQTDTPDLRGFDRQLLSHSGDLRCLNGKPPYVAELFTQRDRYDPRVPSENEKILDAEEMLSACLKDLDATPPASSSLETPAWLRARLSPSDPRAAARCVSLPRLFGALNMSARDASSKDQRLAWRLLQQWVDIHGFMASEVVRQREIATFIQTRLDGAVPDFRGTLDREEAAWSLLLDPAYSALLPGSDERRTCALLNPDYRLPPRPVASWVRDGATSIQTRGAQTVWNRRDLTFVYDSPDALSGCPGSLATDLATVRYDPAGNNGKRWLSSQCWRTTSGDANWVLWTARKIADSGSTISSFVPDGTLASGASALKFAWIESSGAQTLRVGDKTFSPTDRQLPFEHFDLRRPQGGRISGVDRSRMGVWDFALDEEQLRDVLARTDAFLGSASANLARHPQTESHHPQDLGLPTAILEGVTAHLRLLIAELERVERESMANCSPATQGTERDLALDRFGRTLRYAITLEAFAARARQVDLERCAPDAELPRAARWESARAELAAVRTQAYERLQALEQCQPYGIPEDEAPLYFKTNGPDATSRFFGSSTTLLQEATTALSAAKSSRDAARAAWMAQKQNEVQKQIATQERPRRLEQLKKQYGQPIAELCGFSDSSSVDVLDMFDPRASQQRFRKTWRPESCFIDLDNPRCGGTISRVHDAVTESQARFTLCTWDVVGEHLPLSDDRAALARGHAQAQLAPCSSGSPERCVVANGKSLPIALLFDLPVEPTRLEAAPAGLLGRASEACSKKLGGAAPLPSAESIGADLDKACYRGEMGAAMLGILAAQTSARAAESAWSDAMAREKASADRCAELGTSLDRRREIQSAHQERMVGLYIEKSRVERRINNISSTTRTISNASAMASTGATIGTMAGGAVGAGVGAAIGALAGVVAGWGENRNQNEAITINEQTQRADEEFRSALAEWEVDEKTKACAAETRMYGIGISTAKLQADRALVDAEAAMLRLANMERKVRQQLVEGWAVLAQEEARPVPGFTHHFWLDEAINHSKRDFRWARRVAYLFALALEYETQLTQGVRHRIARAAGPIELEEALATLNGRALDRTLEGKTIQDHYVVVRLQKDLLGLRDKGAGSPPWERSLTADEQLRLLLMSPESTLYDSTGKRLGQGIRFTLPRLLKQRCAERLWSVAAMISGEDLDHESTPFQIRLRKRNTFQSHLCAGGDDELQTRAARPSLRLGSVGMDGVGEASLFTSADLLASADNSSLNAFKEGGSDVQRSTELSGRGMYGEYELIFLDGFPLDKLNEVYLRFEFLSVAKN